jgi:hypothetical protein
MVRDSKNFADFNRRRHEYCKYDNKLYRKGGENMAARKWKQLTEKDFTMMKALVEAGISNTKIENATGKSYYTIFRIKKAKSFAEYKEQLKELQGKNAARTNGHVEVKTPQPKVDTLAVLVSINKNLGRLADAWETPNRRSLVSRITGQ